MRRVLSTLDNSPRKQKAAENKKCDRLKDLNSQPRLEIMEEDKAVGVLFALNCDAGDELRFIYDTETDANEKVDGLS